MKAKTWLWMVAGVMLALATAAPALASLSQGYATSSPIATGSLVSLDEKKSGNVVTSDTNSASRLFGVVVPPSSASISLSGGSGQVQVVTTGTADVLVSTAGGDIHIGDYIMVSSIAGVGQKVSGSARVIGTAQTDFTASSQGVTKRTIDDGTSKKEVAIGQIPVVIAVSTYTNSNGIQNYVVPNWLQSLSNTLAGKSVSPIRIVIAGLILVVAMVSITVLLYSAVRNSIISIGRNPLSKGSVLAGLLQILGLSAIILVITAAAMYLVISR